MIATLISIHPDKYYVGLKRLLHIKVTTGVAPAKVADPNLKTAVLRINTSRPREERVGTCNTGK